MNSSAAVTCAAGPACALRIESSCAATTPVRPLPCGKASMHVSARSAPCGMATPHAQQLCTGLDPRAPGMPGKPLQ